MRLVVTELALVVLAGVGTVLVGALALSGVEWEITGAVALVALMGLPGPILARVLLGGRWPARTVYLACGLLTVLSQMFFIAPWMVWGDELGLAALATACVFVSGLFGYAAAVWRASARPFPWATRPA